jgi:transcriptional regulator with PAS, ATPase and Fis domain
MKANKSKVTSQVPPKAMIGKSLALQNLLYLLKRVAIADVDCLITGKTGTGKELAAQAVHSFGNRKDQPFVVINCSALSESLLESELFGHVKGAFTGATQEKIGRFELANGGIIFLDEIGEISPKIQVKLLRVLQERQIERVGEAKIRNLDVQVIAATNRDIYRMVKEGKFREDLYYRLKVFSVTVPSLAERRQDICMLAEHFLDAYKQTSSTVEIASETMNIMTRYSWPGNIRELENTIRHALVLCLDGMIKPEDLPIEILQELEINHTSCTTMVFSDYSQEQERQALINALQQTKGNRTEAAKILGVSRVTVWKRMKQYNLLDSDKESSVQSKNLLTNNYSNYPEVLVFGKRGGIHHG